MNMDKQTIFNTVVDHLRKQGCRAESEWGEGCRYLDDRGRKCAVGCLIPADKYTPEMEGKTLYTLLREDYWSDLQDLAAHEALLTHLQCCHDTCPPEIWEYRFSKIAEYHGLIHRSLGNERSRKTIQVSRRTTK